MRRWERFLTCLWLVSVLIHPARSADSLATVRLIAVGDMNLGRSLGQKILHGATEYPFKQIRGWFREADVVVANLEGPISDQQGETESPRSNVVFCAPPVAARLLKDGGVTLVVTANNHATDYGRTGIAETIDFLGREGVLWVGTSAESTGLFPPAIVVRNGVRIGFVAYTQFVNNRSSGGRFVSIFDSVRAALEIDSLRRRVDLIIASYHGGREYVDTSDAVTRAHMHALIDAGADVVIGHHPHVARGIERYKGKLMFLSLGNCIFYQPRRSWTDIGLGLDIVWRKREGRMVSSLVRLRPVHAGFQPSTEVPAAQAREFMERIRRLSTVSITSDQTGYVVEPYDQR